jgi:hypothetical protein
VVFPHDAPGRRFPKLILGHRPPSDGDQLIREWPNFRDVDGSHDHEGGVTLGPLEGVGEVGGGHGRDDSRGRERVSDET